MKKRSFYTILLVLMSAIVFGQESNLSKLKNTQWQSISHYGNTDTWEMIPLKEKQNNRSKLDYIQFKSDDTYFFHLYLNDQCTVNLSGNYAINQSKIIFPNSKTVASEGCTDMQDSKLDDMSLIFRKEKLYLTQYTPSYDVKDTMKGDTVFLSKNLVGSIETNKEEKYTVYDANRIPLLDGLYKVNDQKIPTGTLIFRLKNDILDGVVIYEKGEHRNENLYENGRKISEKKWIDDNPFLDKGETLKVIKKGGDYLITITELRKNYRSNAQDSTITVYKNKNPVSLSFYEFGKLVSVNDFEKNEFKKYDSSMQLQEYEGPGMSIIYDSKGKERKKKVYSNNVYNEYEYGILKLKRTIENDKITTVKYDNDGKEISTEAQEKSNTMSTMVADPTKDAFPLSDQKFEYYKTQAK